MSNRTNGCISAVPIAKNGSQREVHSTHPKSLTLTKFALDPSGYVTWQSHSAPDALSAELKNAKY